MDIIGMTISASAVILLIMALRKIFPYALSGRTAKLLWLTVAVRLLIPFMNFTFVTVRVTYSPDNSASAGDVTQTLAMPITRFGLPSIPITADIPDFARYIWLFGAVFTGALFLFRHIKTRREFSCALPWEYDIATLLTGYKIRRKVNLCVSDMTDTPFTYGVIFPRIILPKSALAADDTHLKNILCHELGHIKRIDVIYKLILILCAAVHWFNPLVWIMLAFAERDIELACDRAAMSHVKCSPEEYAMTLISMEERRSGLFGTSFTGGCLKERIISIMTGRGKKSSVLAIFAAALTLSAAVCVNFYCEPRPGEEEVTEAVFSDDLFIVSDSAHSIAVESVTDNADIENTVVEGTAEDIAIEYAADEIYIFSEYAEEAVQPHN